MIMLERLTVSRAFFSVYRQIRMNGQHRPPVYLEKKPSSLHQPVVGEELSDWLTTKTQMSRITEQKENPSENHRWFCH